MTMVAFYAGLQSLKDVWKRILPRVGEHDYPTDNAFPWIHNWPGTTEVSNVYGPRLHGIDASDADAMTEAILTARRQHRALADMVLAEFGARPAIIGWPHAMGVRETWHARCLHQLTGDELLGGERFPDAIANGIYPVDIHHEGGTLLRFLDGTEHDLARNGTVKVGRWRDEREPTPACYHIPYRSLVPVGSQNVLVAGRMLDADRSAFAGARVMVNMNQTGEAVGTAAALAIQEGVGVAAVNVNTLRETLRAGGSVVL
jgi:hypothetical protein